MAADLELSVTTAKESVSYTANAQSSGVMRLSSAYLRAVMMPRAAAPDT